MSKLIIYLLFFLFHGAPATLVDMSERFGIIAKDQVEHLMVLRGKLFDFRQGMRKVFAVDEPNSVTWLGLRRTRSARVESILAQLEKLDLDKPVPTLLSSRIDLEDTLVAGMEKILEQMNSVTPLEVYPMERLGFVSLRASAEELVEFAREADRTKWDLRRLAYDRREYIKYSKYVDTPVMAFKLNQLAGKLADAVEEMGLRNIPELGKILHEADLFGSVQGSLEAKIVKFETLLDRYEIVADSKSTSHKLRFAMHEFRFLVDLWTLYSTDPSIYPRFNEELELAKDYFVACESTIRAIAEEGGDVKRELEESQVVLRNLNLLGHMK